ncbi:MAG: alpha/beta fold hydrolase [Pseudomonadota bacterium]
MRHFPLHPASTVLDDLSPPEQDSEVLVVAAHGIATSYRAFEVLLHRILDGFSEGGGTAALWAPRLPWHNITGTLFGFGDLNVLVDRLREDLDALWHRGRYRRIVFIGHSLGGLILRALYNAGRKFNQQVVTSKSYLGCSERRHWSDPNTVDRMVLLAAVNRGISASKAMGVFKSIGTRFAMQLFSAFQLFSRHYVTSARHDGEFVAQLRLECVEAKDHLSQLTTVQLLGSQDDLVGPNDTIDLVTGANFYYLDIPETGHANILDVGRSEEDAKDAENTRWNSIWLAISASTSELKREEVRPWELERPEAFDAEPQPTLSIGGEVTDVVFVIHGIRDPGFWTDKIARKIWKRGKEVSEAGNDQRRFAKVVEGYGFFGMGPFLFPSYRRQKVNWLVERYIEARSKHPKARFHFVGHSHGTYVLAKMLELYPVCRFYNVVFIGSIVRQQYPWFRMQARGQVKRLLNFVATTDFVVALFPRLFDMWNIQDLGGAGHLGFIESDHSRQLYSIKYAVGGHSAARAEPMWDAIANFVIDEPQNGLPAWPAELKESKGKSKRLLERERNGPLASLVSVLSPISIVIVCGIAVTVLGIIPSLLVKNVAPVIVPVLLAIPSLDGWRTVACIAFLAGSAIAWRQRANSRRFGLLRSIFGAVFLTCTLILTWSAFPELTAFTGPYEASAYPATYHVVVATTLVIAWLITVWWILRRL